MRINNDPVEDSGAEFWPNEKMLWVRLGVCVIIGLVIAVGLFIGGVRLMHKIKEDKQNKSGVSVIYKGKIL